VSLDLGVRTDHHIGFYFGHESMMVNGFYMHYGYVYSCHPIIVVVTCMIYTSQSVRHMHVHQIVMIVVTYFYMNYSNMNDEYVIIFKILTLFVFC